VLAAGAGRGILRTPNKCTNPDGVPVAAGARAVHGIPDAELAGAPCWRDIAPRFLAAVEGRRILAYNARFDAGTAAITHDHAGLPAGQALVYETHPNDQ
jgi:DNA polymerase III epsilon subunit-like protein